MNARRRIGLIFLAGMLLSTLGCVDGRKTAPALPPEPGPVTSDITLLDAEGSRHITETDSLVAAAGAGDGGFENYSYRWYRNDILIEGVSEANLSNEAMRRFRGRSEEYTPGSDHVDHALRGYAFKVEAFNPAGEKEGEDSVIVNGTKYEGGMKGVSVTTWDNRFASPEKVDHTLATLLRTNADWISIWSVHFQDGSKATRIYPKRTGFPNTLTDEQFVYFVARAHELGFKVISYPQIWIAGPDGSASPMDRGRIIPSDEWFDAYKSFIGRQAEMASRTGVEMFCIGVELTSTEKREDRWREVIALVRERYAGPLVYSPIVCSLPELGRVKEIPWLTSLDYVGLSMNLETRSGNFDPGVGELVESFERLAHRIDEIYTGTGKEVVILETGAFSLNGCTISPRDWDETVADFQEQADYYEAFFRVFGNKPWVRGMFWNQWNTSQESWYEADVNWPRGVTFLNKPAERVLTSWYGSSSL